MIDRVPNSCYVEKVQVYSTGILTYETHWAVRFVYYRTRNGHKGDFEHLPASYNRPCLKRKEHQYCISFFNQGHDEHKCSYFQPPT